MSNGKGNIQGGFKRNFSAIKLTKTNVIDLPNKLFGFIGEYNDHIMLRSYSIPNSIFKLNKSLSRIDTIALKYPPVFNKETKKIYKDCQGSNIYYSNTHGDISKLSNGIVSYYKSDSITFSNFQAISDNTLVIRYKRNDGPQRNFSLAKLDLKKNTTTIKKYLLPKENNAIFSNDGWLFYDKKNARILYSYFYRGEFICLDTNMNLLYKSKTIDTISKSQNKTGLYTSRDVNGKLITNITQIGIPKILNRYITTDNNKIYILSRIKADNEIDSEFKMNQIIDIYDIKNGKYISSFYIPKYKNDKITHFKIKSSKLIAIFGAHLIAYNLVYK